MAEHSKVAVLGIIAFVLGIMDIFIPSGGTDVIVTPMSMLVALGWLVLWNWGRKEVKAQDSNPA
jgi:hypothetical protein